MRKVVLLLVFSTFFCAVSALAQEDAPSLGDVARQSRQQKQQKDAPSKNASSSEASAQKKSAKDASADPTAKALPAKKPARVITNEELPHAGLTTVSTEVSERPIAPDPARSPADQSANAEQWKSQIQEQKNAIASLQHEIDSLSASIHYAGGNCVANCEQWNERQQQKQQQVDSMKAQLEEQQKRLEDMQEAARKQGFGSAVYEP